MKRLVFLLLAGLLASTASAGLDPDTDSMGIYFDLAGNVACRDVPPFTPVSCYLLLANPSAPVCAFECQVRFVGAPYFISATTLPPGAFDVDPAADGFAVGGSAPFPAPSGPIVLVTWSLMLQSTAPLRFYICGPGYGGPGIPEDCGWPTVGCSGPARICGISSGNPALPVAALNAGCGVVAGETTSFGALKGLFR